MFINFTEHFKVNLPKYIELETLLSNLHSVDSRNFKKWGRSPTTTQNVGEGLKIVGDDFMMKFKLIKNTFSVYLDIFNWASIN